MESRIERLEKFHKLEKIEKTEKNLENATCSGPEPPNPIGNDPIGYLEMSVIFTVLSHFSKNSISSRLLMRCLRSDSEPQPPYILIRKTIGFEVVGH